MKKSAFALLFFCTIGIQGCSQSSSNTLPVGGHIGGECEGCEAIHESPVAFDALTWFDTLPRYTSTDPKLVLSGKVFHKDGSPAPGIIIYAYHTNQEGIYPTNGDEKGWGKRHGYIRGWTKTNENGEYRFFTTRPASYPGGEALAHIHITIKEPQFNEYWINDVNFKDDPLLRNITINRRNRGGDGLIALSKKNNVWYGVRDIYLGRNIPGYPQ